MLTVKDQLQELLSQEVDRKEFLKHVGIAAVAVIGIPAVLQTLIGDKQAVSGKATDSKGYGTSAYGR